MLPRRATPCFVKAGQYPQDVTIHSKEKIKFVGAGMDQVTILGRDIVVGALHVGKWPYGAKDIEISDMTINDQGGMPSVSSMGKALSFVGSRSMACYSASKSTMCG